MAFTITRSQALDATRIGFEDHLDRDRLLEAVRAARARPGHNYRTLLVVAPGTQLDLSSADLRAFAHAILDERPPDAPHGRTAIVAPTSLAFGLARMTQVFMEANPTDLRVFDNEAAACQWMGGTAEPVTP